MTISFLTLSCNDASNLSFDQDITNYRILSLGDSYTIGESVCGSCNFPSQLRDSLSFNIETADFQLEIIAETGWTSSNLISAINATNFANDYDLITLLIGVNNQYTGLPFSIFESDFEEISTRAISLASDEPSKVMVISIFDYSNTPFGTIFADSNTSEEISAYNNYLKTYCEGTGMIYIHAQNLIFNATEEPDLVAQDGLHPSEKAYTNLVKELLPLATAILQN